MSAKPALAIPVAFFAEMAQTTVKYLFRFGRSQLQLHNFKNWVSLPRYEILHNIGYYINLLYLYEQFCKSLYISDEICWKSDNIGLKCDEIDSKSDKSDDYIPPNGTLSFIYRPPVWNAAWKDTDYVTQQSALFYDAYHHSGVQIHNTNKFSSKCYYYAYLLREFQINKDRRYTWYIMKHFDHNCHQGYETVHTVLPSML